MSLSDKVKVIKAILSENSNYTVINDMPTKERTDLQKEIQTLENIADKLEKREFTVAIVGLDKAGKSNLGNALIGVHTFPENSDRCTYTTTMACSGEQYKGEVYFYTEQGFDEHFKERLEELGYPKFYTVTFRDFDVAAFKTWFNALPDKSKQSQNDLYSEIKTLLDLRTDILGRIKNNNMEELDITNKNRAQQLEDYIRGKDKAVTYSIEKIVVKSPRLAEMAQKGFNIILYDVPGFNSPAKLHKTQTIDMLNKADAIVMVMDVVNNANFTDTQVETFCETVNKNKDNYGISIKEKCFIFANKFDSANTASDLSTNITTLKKEVAAQNVVKDDSRIFFGSAYCYNHPDDTVQVQRFNKYITELKTQDIAPNINDINTDGAARDFGVVTLKNGITKYYEKVRMPMLEQKASEIIKGVTARLSDFVHKMDRVLPQTGYESGQYYADAFQDLPEKIFKAFKSIYDELVEQLKGAPFTSLLTNDAEIEKVFPMVNENDEHLTRIVNDTNYSLNGTESFTKIDVNFREVLTVIFLKNIAGKTVTKMRETEQNIYVKCYRKFLMTLGMPENSPKMNEFLPSVESLFQSIWKENNVETSQVNSLIQRFASVLIKTIIEKPFAQDERMKNVEKNFVEILSLSIYYANSSQGNTDRRQIDFLMRILFQSSADDIVNKNAEVLNTYFEQYGVNIEDGLLRDFADKLFMQCCLQLFSQEDIPSSLRTELKAIGLQADCSREDYARLFEEIINNHLKKWFGADSLSILRDMHNISKKYNGIKDKNDMIETVNKDIANLRKFTLEAVIPAIGLELAFLSVIMTNLDIIKYYLKYNSQIIYTWIGNNLHEINPAFNDIEDTQRLNNLKREEIGSINGSLNDLRR